MQVSAQTPKAYEMVLNVQSGEQRLVNRPNSVRREQWPLALGEPCRSRQALVAGIVDAAQMYHVLVHGRPAMNELHIDMIVDEVVKESQRPPEHRIAGCLRR